MFVTSDDVLLNLVDFGSREAPVFLAHGGWVGSWELWQEPFQLMQSHWRCIGYDHRGAGATTARPDQIEPGALVDDVVRVLDHLGVERCVLAGESLGALTCLTVAIDHPERVAGLVIVDGVPAARDAEALIDGSRADYPATVHGFVDACVPEPDSDHIRRWGRQILLRAEPEAAARILEVHEQQRIAPAAERVSAPTLVVHGELDAIVPLEAARALAARIPDATLVTLPGTGHVPSLTRPRELVTTIDDWWDAHAG